MKNKKFTTETYFPDFEYITNSDVIAYNFCPFYYKEKRDGKVEKLDKDYFTYGKGVDCILSREKFEDKFFAGKAPKESVEEIESLIEATDSEIKERTSTGKNPLKTQLDKMDKFEAFLIIAKGIEGKTVITENEAEHIKQSADELLSQPLYKAFEKANTQTIIATEINGVKVKCMLDKLDLKNKIICDDKTTANLMKANLALYLQQLAWYRWIVEEAKGVRCDCYLAVVDKNKSKNLPFKRSSLFFAPPEKLDFQHEDNMAFLKTLTKAIKEDNFPPITKLDESAREDKCFYCDHYKNCPHSRQKKFLIL